MYRATIEEYNKRKILKRFGDSEAQEITRVEYEKKTVYLIESSQ